VDASVVSADRTRYQHIIFDNARWDGFVFRPDDIVISTAPKCGTTWVQMICALLIFQTPDLPDRLGKLSPFLDMLTRSQADVFADLDAQTHRRFIKTHTPRDGLPIAPGVTYICVGRDPRDVFVSWDNHMANTDVMKFVRAREQAVGLDDLAGVQPPRQLIDPRERLQAWIDSDAPFTERQNLRNTVEHVASFWNHRDDPNVVMLHYNDLLRDLDGEMRRLAVRLGITVPAELWATLATAASFAHMRSNADALAADANVDLFRDNARFFNAGTSGQWRAVFTAEDEAQYWGRVNSVAPSDLVQWLHDGGPVSTR
jgi:aryl sulfotransferase